MLTDAFTQEYTFHFGEQEIRGFRETVWRFRQRRPVLRARIRGLVTTFFDRFLNGMSDHQQR